MKRTFTSDEKDLVFNLWKDGAGFSQISRVLEAKPGSIFTILRKHGGIRPRKRTRNQSHLTLEEREEIRAGLCAKKSLRAIAAILNRAPSTISREVNRHRGRRWYKAVDAHRRASRFAKRPKPCILEKKLGIKKTGCRKTEIKLVS